MSEANDADDTAHDGSEATNEHTRMVEIPMTAAEIERVLLALVKEDADLADEDLAHAVKLAFSEALRRWEDEEIEDSNLTVEVDAETARRVRLRYESRKQREAGRDDDDGPWFADTLNNALQPNVEFVGAAEEPRSTSRPRGSYDLSIRADRRRRVREGEHGNAQARPSTR